MYIILNSDGALCTNFDFRKSPLSIRFFPSFDDAAVVLRMLKIRYADDLNDAHVDEFLYPYHCPSWYHPIFSCSTHDDDFPEYDPSDPFGSIDPELVYNLLDDPADIDEHLLWDFYSDS